MASNITPDGRCTLCGEPSSPLHSCAAKATIERLKQLELFGTWDTEGTIPSSTITRYNRCKDCGCGYIVGQPHECGALYYPGKSSAESVVHAGIERILHTIQHETCGVRESMMAEFMRTDGRLDEMDTRISELNERFDALKGVLCELVKVLKEKL